ncbi:spherulation-specific family 4 protein [Arthrobacter sp. NPDC056691]|uniref:spherulation-specific family 4 protein n=1 Tax=Arthrobacter sp. NPDC056691 TaxID=3345913 RepID=UPI003671FF9B
MIHISNRTPAFVAVTAAAISLCLATPAVAATDPAPPLTSAEQRELVPAYFYPRVNPNDGIVDQWERMCSVAKGKSIIVMNPNSGPGVKVDSNYTAAVKYCRDRGHKVVGYVYTNYGQRDPQGVRDDVDKYLRQYEADGIFLDEMNNYAQRAAFGGMTSRSYYSAISKYVRTHGADPVGPAQMVIANPGDVSQEQGPWAIDPNYNSGQKVVDVLVVFEGTAAKYSTWAQPTWVYQGTDRVQAYRFAQLVHSARAIPRSQEQSLLELSRNRHAGYVYVTPEVEIKDAGGHVTNPLWNELSPYWFNRILPPVAPVVGANGTLFE